MAHLSPSMTISNGLVMLPATRHLTPSQKRVLRLRAQGLGIKEVATQLGIAYQTVKNHIYEAYRTLGVDNLASALIAVGWLKVEDPE